MTQILGSFSSESIVRRIQLAFLAGLSLLCISCSTPVVTNSRSDDGSASWAYQQCIASLSRYQSPAACNQIGVSNGSSYSDYTYGSQYTYVNDYQQTDSIFRKSSMKAATRTAYETYVDALPEASQLELRAKWLELAQTVATDVAP
jgi:hypothetical protein